MNEIKPSEEKKWLKYYDNGAFEKANDIPRDKTVWDVIEEKLLEYYDIPALEYFRKEISRPDFRENVYVWARTFRAMGIEPDEVVPVYGPFFPDICAMVFALNMIGACPYFLKLAISKEALAEETKDSKVAIVFDGMWDKVSSEFSKDRFKKVLVASLTDGMPSPKKEIVSFMNYFQNKKSNSSIPDEHKYVWLDMAKRLANYYTGNVKVPFVPNRSTFITSSSGTTVGGVVKGVVATNESTISQLYMGDASNVQFFPKDRCLNHFPPTASTSLNVLFLLALYNGETVIIDPRVSEKDFYNQLTKLKPNMALHTGSAWEAFFNRVAKEMEQGKKFDFSYAKGWTVGGEGTDVTKFQKWNEIMDKAHAASHLFSGYGSSELFSATSVESVNARYNYSKDIMSVGIPYAGLVMGVFDEDSQELSYNQRGELRIKSQSAMKEYYNKPELTAQTKVDGWIKTGDLAEIDDDGFIYIWGRVSDAITLEDNSKLYMFDIANKIKNAFFVDDAIVLEKSFDGINHNLVAHIVFASEATEEQKAKYLDCLNYMLNNYLPENVKVVAYAEHKGMLPYSPTTLKKDKNRLANQNTGFVQLIDGNLTNVEFISDQDGKYSPVYDTISKENKRIRRLGN